MCEFMRPSRCGYELVCRKTLAVALCLLFSALGSQEICISRALQQRFGTALVPSGSLSLKHKNFANDFSPIQKDCPCSTWYAKASRVSLAVGQHWALHAVVHGAKVLVGIDLAR